MREKYSFESRHLQGNRVKRGRRKKDLPRKIELAIGMKVMVTDNIETDLDVTNGARGEVVDIILHPDEPPLGTSSIVDLSYLPLYILVKLHRTRATTLEGLEECVIPVEPATISHRMKMQTHEGKTTQKTVRRRQFPLTAAYAFTDYRSQGQTLPYVLIDIASPPTGTLTLFNLYVALSRSSGRETIRLLRDFSDNLFKVSHDPALMMEDDRLAEMDSVTKVWYSEVIKTGFYLGRISLPGSRNINPLPPVGFVTPNLAITKSGCRSYLGGPWSGRCMKWIAGGCGWTSWVSVRRWRMANGEPEELLIAPH
ncbi:hypothetical protein FPV67DRAFT_1472856 [Lyophyllum atratum]|nr:hypothetical protein FPV67DRAFT_1472856 [Lyophyllum atratum]